MAIELLDFLDPLRVVKGGTMKIIEKNPCVSFVIGPERAEAIRRQANETIEQKAYREARRRTPGQLSDEEWECQRLEKAAVDVLNKIHDKRMVGRLAHWQTTCRVDGCAKQPRTSNQPTSWGHKARRRNFVFCPGHVGARNLISKADYNRLKSNANLRVIAEE